MSARLCPHCNVMSNFNDQPTVGGVWIENSQKYTIQFDIQSCQNCNGLILIVRKFVNHNQFEWKVYPGYIPTVHEAVYSGSRADYIEGVECQGIGATKAAATMFRRSLQQIMIDKKASGKRLIDQIQSLVDDGVFPKELGDWANEIRLWGNEGAHPSSDGLDRIKVEDVEQMREFLDRVFEYAYIMPWKLEQSRIHRENKEE